MTDRLRQADHFEGVVDPPSSSQLPDRLYRLCFLGIDGVRSTKFFREIELVLEEVNGNYFFRAGDGSEITPVPLDLGLPPFDILFLK